MGKKNGLVKSIEEDLVKRKEHLRIIKEKELELLEKLVSVRKTKAGLEERINEDTQYLIRYRKHSS